MARYTFSNLDPWAKKTEKRLNVVVKESTKRVIMQASRVKPGVSRGGTIQPGFVPRRDGFLAASLQSTLYGGTAMSGPDSHIFVAGNMKAGEMAQFRWTAEYARAVHYRGWLWVDTAANQWQQIVKEVVAEAKTRTAAI